MKQKVLKEKKCKVCKNPFMPAKPLQGVCGYQCSIAYARDQQSKKLKAENKVKLRGMMTKGDHLKELQRIFNLYIRTRDKGKPCISCDAEIKGTAHASHYYSVGSHPNLRFDELNVHSSCVECNVFLHGNIHGYRERLPARIGLIAYMALGGSISEPLRLSIPEIIELKTLYRQKIKDLQNDTKASETK